MDTTWTSLSSGWSMLSSSATKIALTAKDNAVKYGNIATQKVSVHPMYHTLFMIYFPLYLLLMISLIYQKQLR